jgi:hypothetical protein
VTKQRTAFAETAAAPLEYYPGSCYVALLNRRHLDQIIELRDAVLEEDWLKALDLSICCLGLGYVSSRLLMGDRRVTEKRHAHMRAVGEALYKSVQTAAQSENWTEAIRGMREKVGENEPDRSPEMEDILQKLEQGEITKDLPFVRTLIQPERGPGASGKKMVEDMAIAFLSRGLLGCTHAEFNRALQARSPKAESLLEFDLHSAFRAEVEEFRKALHAGQKDLFGTLLADHSEDRVAAAYSLAAFIEIRLPLFARAQACARLATQVLRQQGKGTAAEKLGGWATYAGALTREAVASQAASYRLALSLLDPEQDEDVVQLLGKASSMAFDTRIPNGRNIELAKLARVEDGDYIEVQGFANSVNVGRSADGKLIAQVELVDPSSGATASAATIYTHLLHLGVTEGAFCRVNGKFRRQSVLLGKSPGIEVERLSLARLRKKAGGWLSWSYPGAGFSAGPTASTCTGPGGPIAAHKPTRRSVTMEQQSSSIRHW